MKNSLLALLAMLPATRAAALPQATASAQTPYNLIGITRNAPGLRQQDHASCQLLSQCLLPGMPNSVGLPGYVGGTGWDPVRSGAWVTNGTDIAKYDENCGLQCPPMPIPTLGPNTFITGLEVVVGMNQLWMIDNQGRLHFYTNSCPPQPIGGCNTGLAQTAIGNVTTGLAVDEGAGFIFISFPLIPGGGNQIAVLPMGSGCQVSQTFDVPPCTAANLGPILGLACDWANGRLYATDGSSTLGIGYTPGGATVQINGINCCPPAPVADPMIGLAIRPGGATSTGSPCANGPCFPCPMNHSLRNDPLLGNAQFRLGLDNAQSNVFAFCLLGTGPCVNTGPISPPLCGPILTIPYLGNLGPNITSSVPVPCGSSTDFLLPLPLNPALANLTFSSQCLTVCFNTAGAFGTSLSNCLSWQLQGQ